MDGDGADRVVDPEFFEHSGSGRHDGAACEADSEGERWPPKIKAGSSRDDATESAGHHPERIARDGPSADDAASEAHQNVEAQR